MSFKFEWVLFFFLLLFNALIVTGQDHPNLPQLQEASADPHPPCTSSCCRNGCEGQSHKGQGINIPFNTSHSNQNVNTYQHHLRGANRYLHKLLKFWIRLGYFLHTIRQHVFLCRKMTCRIRFGMEPDVLKLGLATSPAKALLPGSPQLQSFCWGSLTTMYPLGLEVADQ